MAALTAEQLAEARKRFVDDINNLLEEIGVTKSELAAALDATNTWCEANAASYNSALPQPARSVLTTKQKARMLSYVIRLRYEVA